MKSLVLRISVPNSSIDELRIAYLKAWDNISDQFKRYGHNSSWDEEMFEFQFEDISQISDLYDCQKCKADHADAMLAFKANCVASNEWDICSTYCSSNVCAASKTKILKIMV